MIQSKLTGIEYARTQCDSSSQSQCQIISNKINPIKHKTQLCNTFSQLGYCNYGQKCKFAHGKQELVPVQVNQALRKRKCNGYWGKGYCSYGVRCQFGHHEQKVQNRLILQMAKGCLTSRCNAQPRLLKILQSAC